MPHRYPMLAAILVFSMAALTLVLAPIRIAYPPLPSDSDPDSGSNLVHVRLHPDGSLYDGDWLGLEIAFGSPQQNMILQVWLDSVNGSPLAEAEVNPGGLDNQWQVLLPWIWNSSGAAGWHTMFFKLEQGESEAEEESASVDILLFSFPVQILPDFLQPARERNAIWRQASSACCVYYYITGTEAERDLDSLIRQTESKFAILERRLGRPGSKAPIVFLPRIFGQGGLVLNDVAVSYTDRNYSGTAFDVILEHELVHWMAMQSFPEGKYPPTFLNEGLAVYLSGGHYHSSEPLPARAAALITLGKYKPLAELADSFYLSQHENGYIEAGAFTQYLVETFGWDGYYAMVRDSSGERPPSRALDSTFRSYFGKGVADLEADWTKSLLRQSSDSDQEKDVDFSARFFDAIRRYQQLFTPSVYYLNMWLPDFQKARNREFVADYLRSPFSADTLALETLLETSQTFAGGRDWTRAEEILSAVSLVLDAKDRRDPDPLAASPLAADYRRLSAAILRSGFEPIEIVIEENHATVTARPLDATNKEVQSWDSVDGSWARVR